MKKLFKYLNEKTNEGYFGKENVGYYPNFIKTLSGELNKIYLFSIGNKKISVKFSNFPNKFSCIEREYKILKGLKAYSIESPKPYLYETNLLKKPFSVMEYIEGTPLNFNSCKKVFKKIAKKAKEIHTSNINQNNFLTINLKKYKTYRGFLFEIESYVKRMEKDVENLIPNKTKSFLKDIIKQGEDFAKKNIKAFSENDLTFCHKDFRPQNIILCADERIKMIDWEHAEMCDPAFDISTFFHQTNLSIKHREQFLKEYQPDNLKFQDRVDTYIKYGAIPSLLWYMNRLHSPDYRLNPKRISFYKKSIERLLEELIDSNLLTAKKSDFNFLKQLFFP